MDGGQPEQKRPRLSGPPPPPPTQWHNSAEASRQLPPPPHQAAPYSQHNSPFPRPDSQIYPLDRERDRRASDHAQYDPQEARRPSSGAPTHGFHSNHPPPQPTYATPREPMVKRDPSDEPPLQYRPPSTGNGSDSHVNPPPLHDPRFQAPPQFDPARQAQPYPQSPFPPQTPSAMGTEAPYAQHLYGSSGLPHSRPDQFASVTYPSRAAEQQVRKKAQRAAQACDSCRTLKAKCDEGRPSCTSCREKNIECRYRDPPPKQQDKASADIMDSIGRLENTMTIFMERIESELRELKRPHGLQSSHGGPSLSGPVKLEHSEHEMSVKTTYDEGHTSSQSHAESMSGPVLQPSIIPPPEPYQPPEGDDTEEDETSAEPIGPPKQPSIPVNHTTGAARLLLVKPIADMCQDIMRSAKIKNERYPIIQENKRGLLRLFGRGEGNENPPMYDKEPTTDHADTTPGDGQSDASSPAAGEEWGQLGGLTPPGNPPQEITRGGINPEGMPDFSRETVISLVQIYKDEMNIMHPILIPRQLDALVESFLRSIPDSQVRPKQIQNLVSGHSTHAGFAGGPGFVGSSYKNPESPSNKRKRSPAGEYPEHPGLLDHKPGHPFRNITAAIVMLCMALGKICSHKGKIPHAYTDQELETVPRSSSYGSSPALRNGYPPSPLQSSPSISAPFGTTSPQESDRGQSRSRRQSIDGMFGQRSIASRPRNIDVIPGLAYFALATDVIGNQLGGNSLQHVHANILAGLYHGQLARVMESHAYIAAACRALQVILRPRLDRFKKLSNGSAIAQPKDNPLIFAFWTCLQLESDIVAELPCPHSGILTYEDDMPGPNIQAAVEIDGFDPRIIESYHAQLFLRKHLNQLHNMFYKPSVDSPFDPILASKDTKHFPTIEASQESLASIDLYARNMLWDHEKGEPANNILEARLRAKYYGAEVITYRNFILPILDSSVKDRDKPQVSNDFLSDINVPSVRKITCLADINPKVRAFIVRGMKALIFSTTAFHGLGATGQTRPVVTNIWGTAHAQWGNMLTLQACYVHPILGQILKEIISREEMVKLLEKTLAFLSLVATPSSALELDRRILDYTARRNGFLHPHLGSSFSSSTTGDVSMTGHSV